MELNKKWIQAELLEYFGGDELAPDVFWKYGLRNSNDEIVETHPDPSEAKSDGANMLKLDLLEPLLEKLLRIKQVI